MLRINVMPRSQTEALLAFFGARLRELEAQGVKQKDIAEKLGVSGAQVSMIANDKREGMRLDNAEDLARYLNLSLVEALQVAAEREGAPVARDVSDIREAALRRIRDLLSPEVLADVRRMVPPPGRDVTEFEWLALALGQEQARRQRIALTADTAEARQIVDDITPAPVSPAPASITQKIPKVEGPKKKKHND